IFIPSIICWFLARIELGNAFSFKPTAKFIIKKGLYKKIRHPIYLFSSLTLLGVFISFWKLYLTPVLLTLILLQMIRAKKEEKILIEQFGKEYTDYKKLTWF
ncbi:MAG: methyltransferase, partial [Candidatus Woesearchaeota archaeon]